jgi:transposase
MALARVTSLPLNLSLGKRGGTTDLMMGTKERNFSPLKELSLEELVPQDNFYRRLERAVDLSFVRELVSDRYASGGRPSVDPVVFFKLQLVLFFEDLRSERRLIEVAADRLCIRWYLGYDLLEPLPDHSSLTYIRQRYGLEVFRRFFEEIVELCIEAGLVWGKELYIDSTKVQANASMDSLLPRFAVEAHLERLFEEDEEAPEKTEEGPPRSPTTSAGLEALPTANDQELRVKNAAKSDWISRNGAQDRSFKGQRPRTSDSRASKTDPDATPMKWPKKGGTSLGYQIHYAVDGGKARIILGVLVTSSEVTENRPMLDLLWRARFRWRVHPRQVTGDAKYGTAENIAAVEREGIRAYMALHRSGGKPHKFKRDDFFYDAQNDLYICPAGKPLRPLGKKASEDHDDPGGKVVTYRAKASSCRTCELREQCTSNKAGRNLRRGPLEEYVDLVRAYWGTEPYEKALRKRAVWVEPLFGEAKEWHRMIRFRLRMLDKVNIEALMVAAGQNIKRLLASHGRGPKPIAQVVALHLPEGPPLCSRDCVRRRRRCVLRGRRRRFSTGWRVFDTPHKLGTSLIFA